jgi:hypothetical protein
MRRDGLGLPNLLVLVLADILTDPKNSFLRRYVTTKVMMIVGLQLRRIIQPTVTFGRAVFYLKVSCDMDYYLASCSFRPVRHYGIVEYCI